MTNLVGCMIWILPGLLWNKALASSPTTSPTFKATYSAYTRLKQTYTSYTSPYGGSPSPRPTASCRLHLVENEGTFDTPALLQPTSMPCSGGKRWMITVPEGHYVEMTLESIDLGLGACFLDTYVIVRDGNSSLSNVLGIYCEQNNKPQNISSSGNKMLVELVRSWRWIYSYNHDQEAPGFKARYVGRQLQTGDAPQYSLLKEEVTLISYYTTLWCQAQGAPAPVITWYKDGKVLKNSTSVTYTSWHVKGGMYSCMAKNSFGQTRWKNLTVIKQTCSNKCYCSMLKSRPFWMKVQCSGLLLSTITYDIPHTAKYLLCQYSSLRGSIPVGLFVNLTSLEYLSIQWTSLNNLTKGAFHGLKELKILEINRHSHLKIQDGAFDSLSSLEYLDMSNNNLLSLVANSFQGPKSVRYLDISENSVKTLPQGIFRELFELRVLDLSKNRLYKLPDSVFAGLKKLKSLDLSNNQIFGLPQSIFKELISLTDIDLSFNRISELPEFIFKDLISLKNLYLNNNKINVLYSATFDGLGNLEKLELSHNQISELPFNIFRGLKSLKYLYLNNNKISQLHPAIFNYLYNLEYLNLQGNLLKSLPVDVFKFLRRLKSLKLDSFSLCCYATRVVENVNCEYPLSARDSFSSCNRMIEASGPRQIIWLLGILAVLGNLAVIAWRLIRRDDHPVQTCLLTNLAVSDFLMGVYLMIIAIQDQIWAGAYFSYDLTWRSGTLCKLAGAMSVLSSEVSVLMLGVITADRLISIVFTFHCRRLTLRGTYVICAVVWVCGIIIAVVPTNDVPYFYNEDRRYGFYGRSSVCLPLQLSPERLAGWEYSVAIFIALNLAAFLFIMAAYFAIILKVYKSQKRINAHGESNTNSTNLKRESALARRVFAIILTDFSCWVPVIILSILALVGKFQDPEGVVYVWFAVFVLPVNSSVNPVLYTFSTPKVRNVLKGWLSRIFHYVRCKTRSTSLNVSNKDNLAFGTDEGITEQDDGNTMTMTVSVTPTPQ